MTYEKAVEVSAALAAENIGHGLRFTVHESMAPPTQASIEVDWPRGVRTRISAFAAKVEEIVEPFGLVVIITMVGRGLYLHEPHPGEGVV